MKEKIKTISYNNRLITLLGGFNYFFFTATIVSFLLGSWVAGIFILIFLSISLYLSYKNARYYLYHIKDENDIVEIHFLDKKTICKLNLKKRNIKVDYIDDGYSNHLRFYNNSELLLKQYIVGYWTQEHLSNFYNNYCKGEFD